MSDFLFELLTLSLSLFAILELVWSLVVIRIPFVCCKHEVIILVLIGHNFDSPFVIDKPDAPAKSKKLWQDGETIEFAGKAVTRLAADKNIMGKTGKILLTSHLSSEYGFKDVDGSTPSDFTSVSHLMGASGHTWLASWIPSFVRVPLFIVHFGSYKFWCLINLSNSVICFITYKKFCRESWCIAWKSIIWYLITHERERENNGHYKKLLMLTWCFFWNHWPSLLYEKIAR